MAAWIAEKGSENHYGKYVKLLAGEDWEDSAEWYKNCAGSLDDGNQFGEFRKKLFKQYPTLLNLAGGSRK